MIAGDQSKLSNLMYKLLFSLYMKGIIKCAWLENVQNILNNCGLSYIWQQQTFPSIEWLKNMVHEKCKDQYVQSWYSAVREGSKCINYRI